jgi:hypothetical protein
MHLLLPSFHMRYQNANLCIYKQLDSSWAQFEMNDGFPQSNAVSALLSCLTLLAIINTLHRDLTNQAESHTTLACTMYKIESTFRTTYWSIY